MVHVRIHVRTEIQQAYIYKKSDCLLRLFSARETKSKSLNVLFWCLDRDLGWFQTGMMSELSSHPHSHCPSIHLKSLCDIISVNWVAWLAVNSLMVPLHGEG